MEIRTHSHMSILTELRICMDSQNMLDDPLFSFVILHHRHSYFDCHTAKQMWYNSVYGLIPPLQKKALNQM